MQNARTAFHTNKALLAVLCLVAAFSFVTEVKAATGGVQQCTVAASCTIGEFLYDDEYNLLNTGTCSITSRAPDGTLYLDGVNLPVSAENDGWYAKTITTPATTGFYRTQICCTVSGAEMCLDKSFEVKAASSSESTPDDIASAVWGFQTRTIQSLSSFGTLIADVWNNATRTLTGAGLSSGQLATQSDVAGLASQSGLINIKKTVDETRLLIEREVNKPIVQNILEESAPDLTTKLKETKAVANQLYVNSQYLINQAGLLTSKWNSLTGKDLLGGVIALKDVLGEESDSSSTNSVFGQINWVRDSWSWDEPQTIYSTLTAVVKKLTSVQEKLADYQKNSATQTEMKNIVKDLLAIEKLVGQTNDIAGKTTLYSRIQSTENMVASLEEKQTKVTELLTGLVKSGDVKGYATKVTDLQNQLIAINKVPRITSTLSKINPTEIRSVKNGLLALGGIINTNKKLLALGAGKTLVNTWLEEGSVIFKTLVTNPSILISQSVDVKYYLPAEVKEEDIIKKDAGLTVTYDTEKGQYYVSGTFTLAKGETRTFSVEVSDVWAITKEDIDSLRQQAVDLSKPLEKTALFAQSVTLKSDINASLDKILSLQEMAVTPEQKIRAYREAAIEKTSVQSKISGLKDLVAQTSSAGNLFGFVGGSQALAVWGIIIVMAAGFIFLTLYMRTISKAGVKPETTNKIEDKDKKEQTGKAKSRLGGIFKFALPLIIVAAMSASTTGFITTKILSKANSKEDVLSASVNNQTGAIPTTTPVENDLGIGGLDIVKIIIPEGTKATVMKEPIKGSVTILTLTTSLNAVRLEEKENWVRVLIGNNITSESITEGWIVKSFVKEINNNVNTTNTNVIQKVTVMETSTGWLRVRATPNGKEIAKVNSGETYNLISEVNGWYEIELTDGTKGFISGEFATLE